MGTLRCRRGLPYEAKSLHSRGEREYHVRVEGKMGKVLKDSVLILSQAYATFLAKFHPNT